MFVGQVKALSRVNLISRMESIKVPERYFCPNPLDDVTDEDLEKPNFCLQYLLNCKAVEIHNGKARWRKRLANRFVQIYTVQFIGSEPGQEGVELEQICGEIIFDVFEIFQRKLGADPSAIREKGFMRLTGPMGPVDGWSYIVILPRLYRANQTDDFYHPKNAGGYNKFLKMKWSRYCFDDVSDIDAVGIEGQHVLGPDSKKPSDKVIAEEADTPIGKMRYSYAIFNDAVDSFVTVKLLEWYGVGPAPTIYGKICALNTKLREAKSTIFLLDRREAVHVSRQQYIPIQRPVNIVSTGHSLEISVRLKHKTLGGSRKEDLTIASRTLCFEAESVTYGRGEDGIVETKELVGKLCKLELKVYFLPSWSKDFYSVESGLRI